MLVIHWISWEVFINTIAGSLSIRIKWETFNQYQCSVPTSHTQGSQLEKVWPSHWSSFTLLLDSVRQPRKRSIVILSWLSLAIQWKIPIISIQFNLASHHTLSRSTYHFLIFSLFNSVYFLHPPYLFNLNFMKARVLSCIFSSSNMM